MESKLQANPLSSPVQAAVVRAPPPSMRRASVQSHPDRLVTAGITFGSHAAASETAVVTGSTALQRRRPKLPMRRALCRERPPKTWRFSGPFGVPPSHLPGGSLPAHFSLREGARGLDRGVRARCAERRSTHRIGEREDADHRLGPASRCGAAARARASSARSPALPTPGRHRLTLGAGRRSLPAVRRLRRRLLRLDRPLPLAGH